MTKDDLIILGDQLSKERDAAFDLWTWLPSHKEAQKFHGDYANEFIPSVRDILIEASMFISAGLKISGEEAKDPEHFYACPCGESHYK